MQNAQKFLLIGGMSISIFVSAAQSPQFVSGSRISFNERTGATVVTDARLSVNADSELSAGRAEFVIGDPVPRVIDLSDKVEIIAGTGRGSADAGTYYPAPRLLMASKISFDATLSRSPGDETEYTCESGTLYGDGQAVEGGSVCDNVGGGSVEISCGGPSGGRVVMIFRTHACPLT